MGALPVFFGNKQAVAVLAKKDLHKQYTLLTHATWRQVKLKL